MKKKYSIAPRAWIALMGFLVLTVPGELKAQFTFTTNNGAITITGYTGSGGNVVIPASINGYPVIAIGDGAFAGSSGLTGVTIPNTVTSIGGSAFTGCYGLTSVTIPNSVTSIGDGAFQLCYGLTSVTIPNSVTSIGGAAFDLCSGLTSVTIGNSVTTIGAYAFEGCSSLTSVTIPNSVTSIGDYAFFECSRLTSVTIPNSVTSIGNSAFQYCSGLTNIAVDAANPNYASAGGVLFSKSLTLLIQCPGGFAGSYAVPNSVTSIGGGAFADCIGLTCVTIGNSVTSIGGSAFAGCYGLRNVTIPNSVTSIGNYAFDGCSGLTNVTIPNSVTSIGAWVFRECTNLHQAYFQGNAPTVDGRAGSADSTVFSGETGTVYYLPGTTGWGATFGGWPTAQWYQPQPQILASGSGFGVQSNRFQFTISWATNTSVVVLASTDLLNWTPVITNALVNGTSAFMDSTWTNYPQRFYRVRSL